MFRPDLVPQVLPIPGGGLCLVFDDILLEPDRWRSRAAEFGEQFEPPKHNAYPGRELRLPDTVTAALLDTVSPWLRHHFGIARIVDGYCRLSMVSLAPEQLTPAQSLCHRDRLQAKPGMLPLASVLYLFDDPSLGGTHFFRPLVDDAVLTRLLVDSNRMEAEPFFRHYGLVRGYMTDSNAYFEKVLTVPARRNRMIVYPGMQFHSGDIARPEAMSADPLLGRLTFNGFFTGLTA
ncbi:MAG: DUF6445 family protein [Arenimonas sp.]